nr:hypothetical protein CFP56_03979 [Quercus suber]
MVGTRVFKDPEIWDIWTRIAQGLIAGGISEAGGPYGPTRLTLLSQLANLDSIPLSEGMFVPGALRIKLRKPLGQERDFTRESILGSELKDHYPPWSQIGKNDIVRHVDDDEGWIFQADYEELRSIILTYPYDHHSQARKDL